MCSSPALVLPLIIRPRVAGSRRFAGALWHRHSKLPRVPYVMCADSKLYASLTLAITLRTTATAVPMAMPAMSGVMHQGPLSLPYDIWFLILSPTRYLSNSARASTIGALRQVSRLFDAITTPLFFHCVDLRNQPIAFSRLPRLSELGRYVHHIVLDGFTPHLALAALRTLRPHLPNVARVDLLNVYDQDLLAELRMSWCSAYEVCIRPCDQDAADVQTLLSSFPNIKRLCIGSADDGRDLLHSLPAVLLCGELKRVGLEVFDLYLNPTRMELVPPSVTELDLDLQRFDDVNFGRKYFRFFAGFI